MLPVQQASAAGSGVLAAFLDQVAALVRKPGGRADPPAELDRLGLTADSDAPAWAGMSEVDWFILLRGMARHCPRLAGALSARRLTAEHGGLAGGMRDPDALSPACCAPPLSDRLWRDRLALLNGCLWKLWACAAEHAESRPMFRRRLGDFPAVRFRLLLVLAELLRAEEMAERAAALPPSFERGDAGVSLAGALRRSAETIRIETQQICGGTGYMRESPYAEALAWLERCDGLLRLGPIAGDPLDAALADDIEATVSQRLALTGISPAQCAILLQKSE